VTEEPAVAYGSTEDNPGLDCLDILESGDSIGDGTYWIDPDGTGAFEVYCDMTNDGGGWTLVGIVHPADYTVGVDEEYTWFRDGNNSSYLATNTTVTNEEPSSFGTRVFVDHLGSKSNPVARFDLVNRFDSSLHQSWFKGADAEAFEEWFADDDTPTIVCDEPDLETSCYDASTIHWDCDGCAVELGMGLTDYDIGGSIHMRINDVGAGPNTWAGVHANATSSAPMWWEDGHSLTIWIRGDVDEADEEPEADYTSPSTDYGMNYIPPGTFEMGCTPGQSDCEADENPVHEVTLTNGMYVGVAEVSRAQWESVMGAWSFTYPTGGVASGYGDYPANEVSWEDVIEYANALSDADGLTRVYSESMGVYSQDLNADGYRLPTEAEWEYAARCGEDTLYSGSDNIDDVGWYIDNSGVLSHEVATKTPNACGLYDMSGNVWEWTWDWYESGYYSGGDMIDPVGPSTGSERVDRGGSWGNGAWWGRLSERDQYSPNLGDRGLGFRLARTVHTDADGDGVVTALDCNDSHPEGVYDAFETGDSCPVAYWDMETLTDSGDIADLIGVVDLAIYGSPTAGIAGVSGSTYSIDSCGDYFLSDGGYPEELRGDTPKSISAWGYTDTWDGDGDGVSVFASFGGSGSTACGGTSFGLSYSYDMPYLVTCAWDAIGPVSSWNLGVWYHMVGTYDGIDLVLYINGIEVARRVQVIDTLAGFDHVGVGIDTWWSGTYHNLCDGRVDEVKLYDYALSPSDVSALHSL
jgi:formylglycine-generating enzyme required for sulfatase activity